MKTHFKGAQGFLVAQANKGSLNDEDRGLSRILDDALV